MVKSKDEKFDQVGCQHAATIFKDNKRHSILVASLLRIQVREKIENILSKYFENIQ